MKTKLFSILILLALLSACGGGGSPTEPAVPTVPPVSPTPAEFHATVYDFINQVDGHPRADPAWEPAFADMSIFVAGEVRAGEASTARLTLGDSLIRVAPNSVFTLNQPDDQTLQLDLQEGQIWLNVEGLEPGENFQVETPGASASVRGTRFSVRVDDKQNTYVSVAEGAVDVSGATTSVDVMAGTQTTVPIAGDPTPPKPMSPEDQLNWGMAQGNHLNTVLPVSGVPLCALEMPGTLSGTPVIDPQAGMFWFKFYPPSPGGKYIPAQAVAYGISSCAPTDLPPYLSAPDESVYEHTVSPTGDSVAYANYGHTPAICTSNLDGSNPACFNVDETGDGKKKIIPSHPRWSPDGQWLLYDLEDYESGQAAIVKVRPDGSESSYIAPMESGYNSRGTWSPDGTQIGYAQVVGAPDMEAIHHQPANIWVAGADGSNPQMIFEGATGTSLPLAWSPDGKWIAVAASGQLWLVSPDGQQKQMLVDKVENVALGYIMWSPTATGWPLFYRLTKENDARELHYVPAPGQPSQMLLNDIYWGPYWSSDASVLFVGQRVILDKEKQLYFSNFYVLQGFPNLLP